jgi:beta-glucanase (GH16 family)
MNISVYYEEDPDYGYVPTILALEVDKIDWQSDYIYFSVDAPFIRKTSEDYSDEIISYTVSEVELVASNYSPNTIGIHIPTMYKRINNLRSQTYFGFSINDIKQLNIHMSAIEELLAMSR